MNRPLKYTLLTLMWVGVAAYVCYAAASAREAKLSKKVLRVDIDIADSSSQGSLVSSRRVRQWIASSGIKTLGTPIDKVDLTGLEELVRQNGFVDRVVANVNYGGVVRLWIRPRRPIVRLLMDGMNGYATDDGYVFVAPKASSLYLPVVTGSYRPPFPLAYTGNVREYVEQESRKIDEKIEELERQKYPVFQRNLANLRQWRTLRRERVKRRWWRLESDESFEQRIKELRKKKEAGKRLYRYQSRLITRQIEQIEAQQVSARGSQKKMEKSYEDFTKLLTFVNDLEKDDFWRSEVVQIIARTTPSGALEVELTPRSGRHTILFGRIEAADEKLEKLLRFYRGGLSVVGWDEYKVIDIRYKDQVVCKK